jgi:two-component system, OmpR family, response regulator
MRLLIIEDDPMLAQAIKDGLEQEAFAVDMVHDGEEGYNAASSEDYDLIILDILLPGMDGMTIAQKLRETAVRTRILILSAKDQAADKIEGLNLGADDYMVKPFSFEELLARVRALLRRPEEGTGEVLYAGDLTLNTITHEAARNKQPITLSAKEYAVLEYLLRNKNKVLSKNGIMTHAWDFDADVLPHNVEAFIGLLRNKVDKPFNGPALIQTVRGFGYTIKDVG